MQIDPEIETTWENFHRVVNMTSRELHEWLAVQGAGEVAESLPDRAGPETGRRVADVLAKRKVDLTEQDVEVMRDVIDLVTRERGDELDGTVQDDATRRRLMDVGHDALRP